VYVLPDRAESLEDFQWVRAEVIDGGGDASICRAAFVDGLTNDQIEHLFRAARDAEYTEIAEAARGAVKQGDSAEVELARLRKRFGAVKTIDFCDAPGRSMAEDALRALAEDVEPLKASIAAASSASTKTEYRGRVWVTRRGVFVDRIASAWLIRRFIDRDARFKFVAEAKTRRQANELRFDMFEGEFTHVGDRCTFETLVEHFALTDPALRAISEIVHDIDLKDEKFGREDAAGIERVLSGIAAANADDDARLARGAQLFDELYALFAAKTRLV
jgi:hypothetical protein